MNYESKQIVVGEWNALLVNDEDGHLSIYLSHQDGTQVIECGADIGNENEWAERFMTDKIEKNHKE